MSNQRIDTPYGRLSVTLQGTQSILVTAGLDTRWFHIDDRLFYVAIVFSLQDGVLIRDTKQTSVCPVVNDRATNGPTDANDRALAIDVISNTLRAWIRENPVAMAKHARDDAREALDYERRELRRLEKFVRQRRASILRRMNDLKQANTLLRKARRKDG